MRQRFAGLLLPLLLAACAGDTTERPRTAGAAPRSAPAQIGVDRVLKHDARALAGLFGPPALDVREGPARKLQWRGAACVLDAYLYPPAGGGEPAANWIDARTPAGADTDRVACMTALASIAPKH